MKRIGRVILSFVLIFTLVSPSLGYGLASSMDTREVNQSKLEIYISPEGEGDGSSWEEAANLEVIIEELSDGNEGDEEKDYKLFLKEGEYILEEEEGGCEVNSIFMGGGYKGLEGQSKEIGSGKSHIINKNFTEASIGAEEDVEISNLELENKIELSLDINSKYLKIDKIDLFGEYDIDSNLMLEIDSEEVDISNVDVRGSRFEISLEDPKKVDIYNFRVDYSDLSGEIEVSPIEINSNGADLSEVTIDRYMYINNGQEDNEGVAIHAFDVDKFTISNSLIADFGYAYEDGEGQGGEDSVLEVTAKELNIINTTISNVNTSQYLISGIGDGRINVLNSIIVGNTNYEFRDREGETNIKNSIVELGLKSEEKGEKWNDLGGNIYEDPKFENGYRLSKDSPAIDKGYNDAIAGYEKDLDGNARIQNGKVDLGAYEVKIVEEERPEKPEEPKEPEIDEEDEDDDIIYVPEDIKPEKPEEPKEPEINDEEDDEIIHVPELLEPEEAIEKIQYEINREDHMSYIIGYEDDTIRPEDLITREEVVTILYRIMNEDFRDMVKTESIFDDVGENRWSKKYIDLFSTLEVVKGYEDGEFKPVRNATRAEISTMIYKMNGLDSSPSSSFKDIKGHWGEDYINGLLEMGWIKGYEDGSFRPDASITRAEFVTMVNNMLNRKTSLENMLDGRKEFSDLKADKWYYEAMEEAINGHEYIIKDNVEIWKKLIK